MTVHTIEYKDEKGNVIGTDIITVPKRSKLKEILVLQQALIEGMYQHIDPIKVKCVYSGSLLLDDAVWGNVEKLAKLIPVIGKEGGIDLDKLENDIPQLIKLFFSQSCDDVGNITVDLEDNSFFLPSVLSELYRFNFPKFIKEMFDKGQVVKQE
jgi:hypothetical protein